MLNNHLTEIADAIISSHMYHVYQLNALLDESPELKTHTADDYIKHSQGIKKMMMFLGSGYSYRNTANNVKHYFIIINTLQDMEVFSM